MPNKSSLYIKAILLGLVIIAIAPWIGVASDIITKQSVLYFYWASALVVLVLYLAFHIKHLIVFFTFLGGLLAITLIGKGHPIGDVQILMTFWALYGLFWLAYVQLKQSTYGFTLRSMHPIKQFLFYLTFMLMAVLVSYVFTLAIYYRKVYLPPLPLGEYIYYVGIALIIPTLSLCLLKIIDMIGPRHFLLFLFGIYHRPVEKDRIVLFLDMVGSTGIANKLSPDKSMALISRFIFDATATLRIHGGDIVNYTGDGVVALWPRKKKSLVLQAVYSLRRRIQSSSAWYMKEFGIVPDFRTGIHAGKVVIGQLGEEKLFLGVYGDTVNVAARLEQMNKGRNSRVMISDKVLENLDSSWNDYLKPLGPQNVSGREEPVNLYIVDLDKGDRRHGRKEIAKDLRFRRSKPE